MQDENMTPLTDDTDDTMVDEETSTEDEAMDTDDEGSDETTEE